MKKHKQYDGYTDEPIHIGKQVADFLPPPHELVFKEKKVKVTIALTQRTVEFFKRQAKNRQAQYQKLIRRLLDDYVGKHEHISSPSS